MKTENLEALLLDRALGQLAPETAELVEEYLAQNPGVAARATAFSETVGLARSAVSADAVETVAAGSPADGWARERRAERWRTVLAQSWKLAACVMLGLAVGWSLRRPKIGTAQIAKDQPVPIRTARASEGDNPAAAFWIAARRAAEKSERASQPQIVKWETLGASGAKGGVR